MSSPARLSADGWELDALDRDIISALQIDGRRPYSQIARDLETSESSVRYRVRQLEDAGIIQVVGIADPLRIGFDLMALIGVDVAPGAMHSVADAMAQLPETSYVAVTAGTFDLFVEVICRDTAHFSDLLTVRIHAIDGVLGTQSFLVLEIKKMAYGWGVGEPQFHAMRVDE